MTDDARRLAEEISVGMNAALHCNHGRWIGEAQFAVCVPCVNRVVADAVADARREERERLEQAVTVLSILDQRPDDVRPGLFHKDSAWQDADCSAWWWRERCRVLAALRAGGPTEEMT